MYFLNFTGKPGLPIRFVNYGGVVEIATESNPSGILFLGSQYFTLSGSGHAATEYGIRISRTGPSAQGVAASGNSSDCEIDHIDISNTSFAGIMVKTDPTCDPGTWRDAFVMRNIRVHHNYIHDTGGEGLYIGNSFWNTGYDRTCEGVTRTVFPHNIYGLEISHNRIERTGAEGIQYGCAPDAEVHHNVVRNAGASPFAAYQNNGIQVGGGSGGTLYNNLVTDTQGNGIIIIGHLGNLLAYNNLVVNSGEAGVFCDDRVGSLPNTPVSFINNTIVGCGKEGIKLYNEINSNTVANNVILNVAQKKYLDFGQGARAQALNNVFATSTTETLGFVNASQEDFRLKSNSSLVDAGADGLFFKPSVDFASHARPVGKGYDVGAFEYGSWRSIGQELIHSTASFAETVLLGPRINSQPIPAGPALNPCDAPKLKPQGQNGAVPVLPPVGQLTIYPSPCHERLTVRTPTDIQNLTIYTLSGQEVLYLTPGSPVSLLSLSVGTLPEGIYLLRAETTTNVMTRRFVKQ